MRKLLFLSFFLYSAIAFTQEDNFWDNVRFGGGIGFGFGSNNTTLSISPAAVYDFNDSFSLGMGIGYSYNKNDSFKSNIISPNIFILYRPIREIEFSSDLQQMYVHRKSDSLSEKYNYPALNLGFSYRMGNVSLGVQYDVLYDKNKSIYASAFSPIVRVFF